MAVYTLPHQALPALLTAVGKAYELYAPVKTDLVRFQRLQDPAQLHLVENAFFPLKEFFFRKKEVILSYDGKNVSAPIETAPKRVFFGVRRCDLNGVMRQDLVFRQMPADPYYEAQRKNSLLIGYHCKEAPSEFCFCGSMDLKDFYDLMFFKKDGNFTVDVGSEKGAAFVEEFKSFFAGSDYQITPQDKHIEGADRLENKDFSKYYDNPAWKADVNNCLSCGACTTLCPTCYCFELCEVRNLASPEKSERVRGWSSCQVKEFSTVAGNHTFRDSRESRFKHRIFHQLEYFKQRYGIDLCVGCGRCISGCPTRIDFVDTLNKMKKSEPASP